MIVSLAITALILVSVASLIGMVSRSYRAAAGTLDSFESARAAFDLVTRTVSQATLMSYLGYNDPSLPTAYELNSDLHFFCGRQSDLGITHSGVDSSHAIFFQTTLGVADAASLQDADLLLSATGFFISYGVDPLPPVVLDGKIENRRRFRLFQFVQPREEFKVYEYTLAATNGLLASDKTFKDPTWFLSDVDQMRFCRPLADNVIFLTILPVANGSPSDSFKWNSRDAGVAATHNRLPQSLRMVLVVIDEKSAARLGNPAAAPAIVPPSLFLDPADYEADLEALGSALTSFRPALTYRIFTAEVPLHASNTNL